MATNPDPSQFPAPGHRTNVLLEEILGKFRHFGEGLADVQEKVSKLPEIEERLERIEEDVKLIKTALPSISQEIKKIDKRLTSVEAR